MKKILSIAVEILYKWKVQLKADMKFLTIAVIAIQLMLSVAMAEPEPEPQRLRDTLVL